MIRQIYANLIFASVATSQVLAKQFSKENNLLPFLRLKARPKHVLERKFPLVTHVFEFFGLFFLEYCGLLRPQSMFATFDQIWWQLKIFSLLFFPRYFFRKEATMKI